MIPLAKGDWAQLVRPGSRVFIGGGGSVPHALVRSMLAEAASLKDLELVHVHGLGETPWIGPEYADVLRTNSFFLTPALRDAVERGQADYTPCPMSEVAGLFSHGPLPLDVALIQVSPPDENGMCSLGVSVDVVRDAVACARVVIAQINPLMPRTHGDTLVAMKKFHRVMKVRGALPELENETHDDRHERIADYAAQLVEDGATLQVGLGAAPEAVARALRGHKNLGIHSGMFTDALMDLVKGGAADGSAKSLCKGKIVASHVLGSRKLYRWVDDNEMLELRRSSWVNNPHQIARNHRMVAVNEAREVDLTGQVVRDSSGHRFFGGIGALQDFIRGAGHSKGGRPIIVLTSTHEDGRPRIVSGLGEGSGVCTGRGDVHYVVTEFGVASLHGASIRERVARLVEIAHPGHREDLLEGARVRGWLPKFFTMPRTTTVSAGVESKVVNFKAGRMLLRPLHPSDMRPLQEFFYSHDEETVRMRYGYQRERMTGESAYKLAAVDQRRDVALGIFAERRGRQELRAIGRYYLDEGGKSAEVAFIVHESMRQMGIAGFLLCELARIGKKRGIVDFWGSVLRENSAMAALFFSLGGVEAEGAGDERTIMMKSARIVRMAAAFEERKGIRKKER
ncbi:MAG: GNAT family N-acetyltransferase [Verrucomicrobiota bacterium]